MSEVEVKVTPSAYQQAVIDWTATGKGSVVVMARAGSGKTKVIELSLPAIPESKDVLALAFNKSAADTLNSRIVKLRVETGRPFTKFKASTFHSLGVNMIKRHMGRFPQTDDKKMRKIAEAELNPVDYAMYADYAVALVGYAKGEGIGAITADVEDAWYQLARHHDLTLESEEADEATAVDIARYLLGCSNKSANGGYIDFDDMLYLPLLWKLRPQFLNDWVIVDEAQDTSPVRRALAKLALKPGGRSMWVGDDKQAIYGFTGASAQAIDLIKREFNASELPLTICYRCAKAVVAEAQTIVPDVEWYDAAPEGKVEAMPVADALKVLDEHDAILCRNTAPLIQTAYALIAQGRGCVVLGRDIGKGLISLIKRLRVRNIDELEAKVEAYRQREVAKHMAAGKEGQAERINDHCDCIVTLIQSLPEDERTIVALIARIERLFSDSNGVLTLSTVHKAKGKEWDRVGILRPDLMPSKFARQTWQVEQESNLKYVAITRAQRHLIWMQGEEVK